jgi:hypothetical protein
MRGSASLPGWAEIHSYPWLPIRDLSHVDKRQRVEDFEALTQYLEIVFKGSAMLLGMGHPERSPTIGSTTS